MAFKQQTPQKHCMTRGRPHARDRGMRCMFSFGQIWHCCTPRCSESYSAVLIMHSADWLVVRERALHDGLCTCLQALPHLVCGAVDLPLERSHQQEPARFAERFSYHALSALICATQLRTAWALHKATDASTYCSDDFHSFWPSAVSRYAWCTLLT